MIRFIKLKEEAAQKHNEGGNEAFVVAAEVFISHKLGHRDNQSAYNEFLQYVDGNLVLAPVIYVNLPYRNQNETYNDFILRLFNEGIIKCGNIEDAYNDAMCQLEQKINL